MGVHSQFHALMLQAISCISWRLYDTIRYDTIRYNTIYLRALKSWRTVSTQYQKREK